MSVVRICACLMAVLALVDGASAQLRTPARGVTFRSSDGRMTSALLVEAGQRPAPAVILVPMLGRGKEDWQVLAERLAEANITALAIDLPEPSLPADARELAGWPTAVTGALDYLVARGEVRASSIGVAGASLGANLAAAAAGSDLRVRALALISPSLDYRGVRIESAMKQYGDRPALLMASLKDPYAARSVKELAGVGAGLREVRWAEAPAHGTLLLAREPDLVRVLVEWFQRTLG